MESTRSGKFYGQCSEICGFFHGFMPIVIKSYSYHKKDIPLIRSASGPSEFSPCLSCIGMGDSVDYGFISMSAHDMIKNLRSGKPITLDNKLCRVDMARTIKDIESLESIRKDFLYFHGKLKKIIDEIRDIHQLSSSVEDLSPHKGATSIFKRSFPTDEGFLEERDAEQPNFKKIRISVQNVENLSELFLKGEEEFENDTDEVKKFY